MYFVSRINGLWEGEERDRGIPRRIASDAAREKLRTVVMEIIVDAKQRFRPFRRVDGAATVRLGWGTRRAINGTVERSSNRIGERT